MKGIVGKLARAVGYTAFFIVALAAFVYLTLPLDQVQAYLVRRAADEHELDLEITALRTAGLGGLEVRGVTLRTRPTAEEREALARAKERQRQWDEANATAKTEGKGKDEEAKAGEAGAALTSAAGSEPTSTASAPATPEATAQLGSKGAKAKPPVKEQRPALPPGPQPVHIDRLMARVALLDLLRGNLEARLEVEALGGRLEGTLRREKGSIALNSRWDDLALELLPTLRDQVGMPFAGAVSGQIDLSVPRDEKSGKADLVATRGTVELAVTGGRLGPTKTVPAGSALHEGLAGAMFQGVPADQVPAQIEFDLPPVRYDRLGGKLVFGEGKANLEDFTLTGPDVEGDVVGHLILASKLNKWMPRLHQRFRFTEAFLQNKDHKSLQTVLQGTPRVRSATDGEGYLGIQYTGFLTSPKPMLTRHSSLRKKETPQRPGATSPKPPAPTRPGVGSAGRGLKPAVTAGRAALPPKAGAVDEDAKARRLGATPLNLPDPSAGPIGERLIHRTEEGEPIAVEAPPEEPIPEEVPPEEPAPEEE